MTESSFINPANWREIEKGYFFQAAMYYLSDTKQPLRFLKSNGDGSFIIETKNGDFDPVIKEGKKKALEQDIIITVKPRQVVVLSNDLINQSNKFEYIQVAPVLGLCYKDSIKNWYNELINDKLEGFAYIP